MIHLYLHANGIYEFHYGAKTPETSDYTWFGEFNTADVDPPNDQPAADFVAGNITVHDERTP